jgi:hypothetical protein
MADPNHSGKGLQPIGDEEFQSLVRKLTANREPLGGRDLFRGQPPKFLAPKAVPPAQGPPAIPVFTLWPVIVGLVTVAVLVVLTTGALAFWLL